MYRQEIKYIKTIKNIDDHDLEDKLYRKRNNNQKYKYTKVNEKKSSQTPNIEKTLERSKYGRKNWSKYDEDLKGIEEIWQQREADSKKQDSGQIIKSSELDTLVAIAAIIILFCLAFHLAPYQFLAKK